MVPPAKWKLRNRENSRWFRSACLRTGGNAHDFRDAAFLVDDELPALKRLGRLLEATGRVEIQGSSSNPATAINSISADPPDVLFLDIEMPEIDGFELLSRLQCQPLVIFTTAYNQYALKAFEVNSIDYLLKPVEPELLERALNKLERLHGGAKPGWLHRPDFRALLCRNSRGRCTELSPNRWSEFPCAL